MAWPITDWSGNPDWAAIANVSAFVEAINERLIVYGNEPLPTKTVDDDVQAAAWFASMQTAIENMYHSFVVFHPPGHYDNSAFPDPTYYGGLEDLYANLAALFSAAGLSTSTWRAYTTHPDDAGADQARGIEAGDIIGPWLFEDLQKVLKVMVLTLPPTKGGVSQEIKAGSGDGTWAEATGEAEAAFAAYTPISGYPAQAYSRAYRYNGDPATYLVYIQRGREKYSFSGIPTAFAHSVECYARAIIPWGYDPAAFDANGDDVIEDKWSLFDTISPSTDASVETSWLGSIAGPPTWCSAPPEDADNLLGWALSPSCFSAIIRWNVAGGFVYV